MLEFAKAGERLGSRLVKKTLSAVIVLVAMLGVFESPASAQEECPYSWDVRGGFWRYFCGEDGLWAYYPDGTWYLLAPRSSPDVGTPWE